MKPVLLVSLITSFAVLSGCAELAMRQKERQMELVARDWSMTIRASQVIPVYPLSQDLIPGDVFLVQTPIAEQSRRYRDRGFLPTDLQVARLAADGYSTFYQSYEKTGDANSKLILPRDWRIGPPGGSIAESILGPKPKEGDDISGRVWRSFPRAGFPSYTFEVSNRGGLSAALPIQGIPVALSATGAARATGSVTMGDAVSYGIDAQDLYNRLRQHLQASGTEGLRPPRCQVWYLRVVTRVFAAKRFDIVLTSASSFGAGLDVGAPKPVADTSPPKPLALPEGFKDAPPEVQKIVAKDLENQADNREADAKRSQAQQDGRALQGGLTVDSINKHLKALESGGDPTKTGAAAAALVPGASLRATFASGRTIGFQETYAEPIVIGYHGFDVAIDSDGNIGAIVPTFAVLDRAGKVPSPTALSTDDSLNMALLDVLRAAQEVQPEAAAAAIDAASRHNTDLRSAYVSELHTKRDYVSAWRRATETWINAAPSKDATAERRRQVRGWLAGELMENGLKLQPAPVVSPTSNPRPDGSPNQSGPTGLNGATGSTGPAPTVTPKDTPK